VDGSGNLIITDGNGGTSNDNLTISLVAVQTFASPIPATL